MEKLKMAFVATTVFLIAVFVSWTLPGFPAFAFAGTLLSFIYANTADEEKALVVGFATGLFLDLITQEIPGINAIALGIASFTVSKLKSLFSYGTLVWYFLSGFATFVLRTAVVLLAHLVIDGTLTATTDLRAFVSAALWTGILSSFYFMSARRI